MSYKLIYTLGREVDSEYQMKGSRGDLLLQDERGNYYEINYITIERLSYAINELNPCYFESNLVVVLNLDFELIINSIKSLIQQEPLSQDEGFGLQ